MAKINTGDKNLRITFRCDEKLGEWVETQSAMLGLTPSSFVRQNLFSMMAQQARLAQVMEQTIINTAKSVGLDKPVISSEKAVDDEHNLDHK